MARRKAGRPRKQRRHSHKRHHKRRSMSGASRSSFQNSIKYNIGSVRRFPTIASRTQTGAGIFDWLI